MGLFVEGRCAAAASVELYSGCGGIVDDIGLFGYWYWWLGIALREGG